MSRKIIGVTVGSSLPKPNFDQTDPRKGDYIRGDRTFITPDETLTHSGRPAEAKATGDAINLVQTNIDNLSEIVNNLDGTYYTEAEIDSMIDEVNAAIDAMPDANHDHNDLYYTKDEVIEAINNHSSDIDNPHSVTKEQIGLDKVDNTSDADKPISDATAVALEGKSDVGHDHDDLYYTETEIDDKLDVIQSEVDTKVDKDGDKVLSTNDYTTAEKDKLHGIEANANLYIHPTHTPHGSGLYKVAVDSEGHVSDATLVAKEDIVALGIPAQDTVYDDSNLKNRIESAENSIVDINEALDDASRKFEGYKTSNDYAVSTNTTNIEKNRDDIKAIQDDYLTSVHETQLQDSIKLVSDKADENAKAIEVLNGVGEGSVQQSINNAFNEFATNVTNDDVVNTYIELINYAAEHGPEFTNLVGVVDGIDKHVGEVENALDDYKEEVSEQFEEVESIINSHADNMENPHGVTKEQIGLASVDDTSDMDKPVSNATWAELETKANVEHNHDDLYYDKEEILGLITVDDIDDICALNQGDDSGIDPVTAATKYWVQAYYQPKGDYLTDEDLNNHNTATNSHNDIRLLIENIANEFYTFADCDDETLSQLQEVVNYIKNNASLIEGVTTSKVNVSDIVNNLSTNATNKPLSAAQGVVLKALIDAITIPTKVSELENDSGYIKTYTETDPTVPAWAKEPNKPTYTANEVGAASTTHRHSVVVTGSNKSSTVTGVVTVPSVGKTQKYMTAYATAPIVSRTGYSVLGTNTQFTTSGGEALTTKLTATASGVAVGASGTANAITGFGEHTTAAVITDLNTTTIKNPTVTPVSIPNVTGNDNVTASKVSATVGSAASWSASVFNGVLSFDWIANTPTTVTTTDVSASKVTLGEALNASSVSTADVTVATGSKSTADAITALGASTTAVALTGVEVTAQPTVTIVSGDDGDVTVATGIGQISVTAIGDEVEVITSVDVSAPAITLTNNESNVTGAVPVISAAAGVPGSPVVTVPIVNVGVGPSAPAGP